MTFTNLVNFSAIILMNVKILVKYLDLLLYNFFSSQEKFSYHKLVLKSPLKKPSLIEKRKVIGPPQRNADFPYPLELF